MNKSTHEIRDPVHVFVKLTDDERMVIDSAPFQRLRHIHQLALTYLVYPGACHKRFEHSLGVMELSSRIFDQVAAPESLSDDLKTLLPELGNSDRMNYWRRILRFAALCHDIGHLPFSHAAERELFPEGWGHEKMSVEIILSDEMRSLWKKVSPPIIPEDVAKIAVGPEHFKQDPYSDWEALLSEMIIGDSFGADRMDYLLRDSLHAGVPYGKFDHFRLIDTLRIMNPPPSGEDSAGSREPVLGVEEGGLKSAEALLLARYFMYSQVYFHPIRRVYDIHLKDFLRVWLNGGHFSTEVDKHLAISDVDVIVALAAAVRDSAHRAHVEASRIINRNHFRLLYERNPDDLDFSTEPGKAIYVIAKKKYGDDILRYDDYKDKGDPKDFPILMKDGRVVSSLAMSDVIKKLPLISQEFVYVERSRASELRKWLNENREEILARSKENPE